jgi:hypothetical protein
VQCIVVGSASFSPQLTGALVVAISFHLDTSPLGVVTPMSSVMGSP